MTSEQPQGLSPFLPLTFLGLVILTGTWGSSVLYYLKSTSSTLQPPQTVEKPIETNNKKKQQRTNNKKTDPSIVVKKQEEEEKKLQQQQLPHGRRAFVVLISWIIFIILLLSGVGLSDNSEGFDPYKILKVKTDVTKAEVKRVYRQMSMELHPDRLTGKPEAERIKAENEFVLIAKAYKTLTDEEAMNNWLEYGHPDGRRTNTISFGIPEWMTKQENASFVIALYLLLFVIIAYFIQRKVNEILSVDDVEEIVDEKKKQASKKE